MLTRIRKAMDEREGGFTLIELLVVIIIIGILAAIAIPVFLKQREKGYKAQMKADLKNAATAEESWATENNGAYTTVVANLQAEGYNPSNGGDVVIAVVDENMTAAGGGFCLSATHAKLTGVTYYYASSGANAGVPSTTACVAS
jgi:type IV pilus assembly protein PilA